MRTIALSLTVGLAAAAGMVAQNEPLATLASGLSQNDAVAAMSAFDGSAKERAAIESDIEALVAQAEILCALDVVEEKGAGDVRSLDVDWYMQLKSVASQGPTERRRERVQIEVSKIKGKWKITSLSPRSILAPIQIGNAAAIERQHAPG
jgi:hypothetical protein